MSLVYSLVLTEWSAYLVCGFGCLAFLAFAVGRTPPYGKHATGSEKGLNARAAWFLQEAPSFFVPLYVVLKVGIENIALPNAVVIGLFAFHYFQRSCIYPLFLNKNSNPMPYRLLVFALVFTTCNGFAVSTYEAVHAKLPNSWTRSLQFQLGVAGWFVGWLVNMHSDHILRNLRKPNEKGHKIPRGGAFEYVSGANYTGEIIEWWGLAMASSFHLPVTCFAISTTMTIGTRAISHHKYYQKKFDDYPKNRKAFIPFIL